MMQGYFIEEQKDGRGEDAEMVLIKQIKKGVSTDTNGKISGMFPLKSVSGKQLPCLKVVVSNGSTDHRFEIRWSNYYEQKSEDPGKFKLVRIDNEQPIIFYQEDCETKRKINDSRTGKPMVDYVRMAQEFGTEAVFSEGKFPKFVRWEFGPKQGYVSKTTEMWETETMDRAEELLTKQFGEELATEAMELFVTHELFNEFYQSELAAAA